MENFFDIFFVMEISIGDLIEFAELNEDHIQTLQSHPDFKRSFIRKSMHSKDLLLKAYMEYLEMIPADLPLYKLGLENLNHEEIRKNFPDYLEELKFWMEKMDNIVFYTKYYESKQNPDEYDEKKKLKLYHKLKNIFLRVIKVFANELIPDS